MSTTTSTISLKKAKAEAGKLKKIAAALQKIISKEFLWMLFVLMISIPIALIGMYIIHFCTDIVGEGTTIVPQEVAAEFEEVASIISKKHPTFMVLYGITVLGIYFSRMVIAAIKTQLANKK